MITLKIIGIILLVIFLILIIFIIIGVEGAKTKNVTMRRDGQEINIYAVAHNATQTYWDQIQAGLDKSEVVLFEGIHRFPLVMESFKKIAKYTDTVYQEDGLGYNFGKWICADIWLSDLYSFYTLKDIDNLNKSADTIKGIYPGIARIIYGWGAIQANNDTHDPLIWRRNHIPIELSVDYSGKGYQVAILYGMAHLRGIVSGLENQGFKKVKSISMSPWKS